MLRSLFAGVSGLVNHQTKLDVIGNNIANINTIGFKSGRVSFQELLTQTVQGGSRPGNGRGGTNPIQVGLGMSVASVDTMHKQGNLQATGNMYDLAMQGEGFFVIGMGNSVGFSRAGSFGLDGDGQLVHQSSGGILQGYLPDSDGVIRDSTSLQDIIIDKSDLLSASATTYLGIAGNLKADSQALGTVTLGDKLMKVADGGELLIRLSQQEMGMGFDLRDGDAITIGGSIGGTAILPEPSNLVVSDSMTLDDLLSFIQNSIDVASGGTYPPGSVTITDGQITVAGHATDTINGLNLTVGGNPFFNSAFTFPTIIGAGESGDMEQVLLTAAEETDALVDLYNSAGEALNGPNSLINIDGMTLSLDAYVGGEARTPGSMTVDATTTVSDLMDRLQEVIGITNTGTAGLRMSSNGEIRVEGNTGLLTEIDSINISDANSDVALGSTFLFTELQAAKDSEIHPVSVDVYDSLGDTHQLTLTFRKVSTGLDRIEWFWEAELEGDLDIQSGDRGRIAFDSNGDMMSFSFEDGSGSLRFDPGNGASMLDLSLQTDNGSAVITQAAGPSTAKVVTTDGYGQGTLESTYVDELGTIVGQYSNGINQELARIAVSRFSNPGGLLRTGNNMFTENTNSGRPIIGSLASSAFGSITPGALEMSNVDLAQEFTQMITAQRGFQANARIISTGDEMLTELVNIKR